MRLDSLLRPARMPTPESSERLGHVVVQAHVALMLAFALLVALPALGAHRLTFADLGTRCVIVAAVVVQAAWMLRSGERVGQLVLAFGVLVVAAPILVREPIPGETTVGILITSAVLLGARVLVPWAAVISAGLSWVPFVLSAARLGDGTAKGLVLQDYALATAMGMAAVGFVNSLEMLAARSARSAAFTRGRRSALLRQAAETEAVNHAQRILHDDVLGTLQLIINGPLPDLDALQGVQGHCARKVESISQAVEERSVPSGLETGLERQPRTPTESSYGSTVTRLIELAAVQVSADVDPRPRRRSSSSPRRRPKRWNEVRGRPCATFTGSPA